METGNELQLNEDLPCGLTVRYGVCVCARVWYAQGNNNYERLKQYFIRAQVDVWNRTEQRIMSFTLRPTNNQNDVVKAPGHVINLQTTHTFKHIPALEILTGRYGRDDNWQNWLLCDARWIDEACEIPNESTNVTSIRAQIRKQTFTKASFFFSFFSLLKILSGTNKLERKNKVRAKNMKRTRNAQ